MKQKIIFCIPGVFIGGVESALYELLLAINKLNLYDISVITKSYKASEKFNDLFKKSDITFYDMSLKWKCLVILERFIQKLSIKRIIKKNDIVIDFMGMSFAKYYAKFNGPKICWLHWSDIAVRASFNISHLAQYNKIVCVSNKLATYLQNTYPELKDKAIALYIPLNLEQILKSSEETLYTTHSPYFAAVQRLDPKEKDVATIIKAFNKFSKNNLNYYLYIVGGGKNIKII